MTREGVSVPDYDVVVVGARIAGSLTAALLGERGWRVLLLDRAAFPSDTLSTHFFRAPALLAFRRAGVLDKVLATGGPPLPHILFDFDGHVFREPSTGPEGLAHYLCIRRIVLDDILVKRAAREPAVDMQERTTARSLVQDGDRVVGIRASREGQVLEASARVVVGADGFRSLLARMVRPAVEHSEPVRRAMYYAYVAGLEPADGPAAEFHFRENELVYVFPCDSGLTLLAVSVPIDEFPDWKRNGHRLFAERLQARPALAPRLARAQLVGKLYGAGDIPGYVRVPYGPGWALVGDAGIIMDPYTGQGIDQGSTHAVLLADALHRWLAGDARWEQAMADYHAARNEFTWPAYRRTCAFAKDLRLRVREALASRGVAM